MGPHDYPVGLTPRELEQRAWIEGDLKTVALLRQHTGENKRHDVLPEDYRFERHMSAGYGAAEKSK